MHQLLSIFYCFAICFNVVNRCLRRPKRCVPKLYVKSRLNFCGSSVLDPIGDRILIGNDPIPGRGVGDRWRPGLCVVFRGVVLSVGALYSLLGLCIVISCIPIQFSPSPPLLIKKGIQSKLILFRYPCWADLVYWVGFGPAMAFTTHMCFLRFRDFSTFVAFRSEVVTFGKSCIFSNFAFSTDFGETMLPKCSY